MDPAEHHRDRLTVRGAREHNLKDISVTIPRDAWSCSPGCPGRASPASPSTPSSPRASAATSSRSSAYARQFLGQLDKPDVDFIEGLSPAVSIDQKSTSRNPRSTVGTITEVYDYLRLLFARIGKPHCPQCGRPVGRQTRSRSWTPSWSWRRACGSRCSPRSSGSARGSTPTCSASLQTQGFSRARVDGVVHPLSEPPTLKKQEKHTIEVVVDRLAVKATSRRRLTDSIETALGLAGGIVSLDFVDRPRTTPTASGCSASTWSACTTG